MRPFLEELAIKIISQYPRLEELTMVFPNRRAALFFRSYLTRHLTKPAWSPVLITIEELFQQHSKLLEADKFSLIYKLFEVYRKVLKNEEPFDRFYFWGDMLLRDFEEVDKYLIPAPILFKDLSKLRELDETFDYLTDEQRKFLRDFWLNFEEKPAGSKEEFLKVWRALPQVYKEFVKSLRAEGLAYEGMIHRDVAEAINKEKISLEEGKAIMFAGFNALTKSEEVLLSYYVDHGASVAWDLDEYYVNQHDQEAGQFFRQYRKHAVLGKTFEDPLPDNFAATSRDVNLYGVPQKVGQAKLLGQLLKGEVVPRIAPGNKEEEVRTVIVLPDESMLMAVMHSLPEEIGSVNVTMGYPLRNTPLNILLELILDLQINRRGNSFNHHTVTAILGHAYVLAVDEALATELRLDIIHKNRIYIPVADFQNGNLLPFIFQAIEPAAVSGYLLDLVQRLGAGFDDKQSFDREYAYHFHRTLSRLHEVLNDSNTHPDLKGFQKLFRQVTQSLKIPFTGEPLKGLQIMGVLETRNLDFENVFVLSLNEGSLPASPRQGSYIPHGIRKAYGLPTYEHQDAMYAYLFYRVLQRANTVRLFYNTETDKLGLGEMSRLLQQLLHESGWDIKHHILANDIQLKEISPIVIEKTATVMGMLGKYTDPEKNGLSPSVLNDFIECSLRFYLKHVAGLREAEEVEEDLDARILGNFVHNVMDWFYREILNRKKSGEIVDDDLDPLRLEAVLSHLIDQAFREHYNLDNEKTVEYRGTWIVVRAIVLQFTKRILELDRQYTPFTIEFIEEKKFRSLIAVSGMERPVILSGQIDRVDNKNGLVRIVDYKTGRDLTAFDSIDALFQREGKRNKAAFQTILYSWLYLQNKPTVAVLTPMLMSRKELFSKGLQNFLMGKSPLVNVLPSLPEFEMKLKATLEELFDPSIPFSQTTVTYNCKFCSYKNICRR